MDSLEGYLERVMGDMDATWPEYEELRPGVTTYPIPFFGDVRNARVLTVGVNPSADEFNKKRRWQDEMTASELNHRLRNYFMLSETAPHEWFDPWKQALEPLGVSYQEGAAHIDLSPRATLSMGQADQQVFKAMVEQDIKWFFQILQQCSQAQLLLFAGCVADKYINDFVRGVAPAHSSRFEGALTLKSGEARVGFYRLRGSDIGDFPAFFCSVSPSGRNEKGQWKLTQRVQENQQKLLGYMNE